MPTGSRLAASDLSREGAAIFYATHKSITGRRAHNPIHPGDCSRRCSCVLCGDTNRRCLPPF
ncbi:hypothetical protein BK796_20645 [Kosakonia pseudosacchari]|uniref:Uncharacterized protein n=1 Tax=Kosakonia pseudosacchari TaxID=1646340 RepID=A0ABX4IJK1_9ENTR|nr:hypothetical protein BK796_20645 [Kosakonia pseudosacchari]